MDLLGHVRQKIGNEDCSHQESAFQNEERHAASLLLVRMSASLKLQAIFFGCNYMMQKIATKIFIYSSVAFGIAGILNVLTLPENGDNNGTPLHFLFMKLMFTSLFFVLSSFAISVASKYLNSQS